MEVRNALRSAGYGILPRATGAAVLVLPRQQKGRTMLDLPAYFPRTSRMSMDALEALTGQALGRHRH